MTSEKLKLPTLLLIADNPSINHWMKKNLEGKFYIIEVSTVSDALETAQFAEVDFIILDSHFEGSDALELTNLLRQINTVTPILLITGRLKKTFRKAALAAGITDFLNDQLAIDELEMRIASGQKEAKSRKKTSDISFGISTAKPLGSDNFLKNKTLLNQKAQLLLADIKKQNLSLSLLLLRLDHFHELQIKEGAIETELLFSILEKRLRNHLRRDDLLIPSSNGFFILLLPSIPLSVAQKIAEQLRRAVQHDAFEIEQKTIHLTISIVVSALRGSEEQYKKIIALGTQSLNQAQNMSNFIIALDKEIP